VSDPLGLFPIAIAAGGGHVDGAEAQQLVAAGLTLLQRSAPVVRALHRRRSGILLPTSPAFFTALAASEGRGAVLINPLAAPSEIAYQIDDANVGVVFTTSDLAPKLPPNVGRVLLDDSPKVARTIVDGISRDVDLGSHVGLTLEGDSDAHESPDEVAIVYTSALSGFALGASLRHENVLSNAKATIEAAGLANDSHSLAVLPFAHLFGLVVAGAAPLLAGGRVSTMPRFNPARVVDQLETDAITDLIGVPSVFGAVLALLERRDQPLATDRLRLCICGGAPLSTELQDRWFDLTGVELRQGYGLTEAGPVCLFNRVDLPNRRGALGVPIRGVRVSIRSESGQDEITDGSEGEIFVAGPNVFAGYVNSAMHPPVPGDPWSAGLARAGEWLRTGDRGVRRADGTFSFSGVSKPMFTRNGFNIYPREIERVVRHLPGVRDVTVSAIPDALRENEIRVDVEGDATIADVKSWCDARLSVYKRPSVTTVNGSAA
jgi:long-chain acyl-CoA synthetase